ncbi:MAG: iron-sulfur cluster assembly scaffold protein [Candidatus Nanoarchaeia archaeon]|nr:iron-sulfur cluster assembly scaffold protein [Candidatus Nanoarchaeia archaeon]MDD5741624.1 iron-sulfur cluster assembly scaffold protein [Candidatus Nanoarchaeia archaeon]
MENRCESLYSKEVIKHFKNPKNMGEMKDADAVGKVGNPRCGDILRVFLKIEKKKINGKEKDYIKDIKFQTFGCMAAIAVSSVLTEMVKGKTIEEAKKLKNNEIVKKLGGLPAIKYHCSLLGAEALNEAIKNYESRLLKKDGDGFDWTTSLKKKK